MPSTGPARSKRAECCAPPDTKHPIAQAESKTAGNRCSTPDAACPAPVPAQAKLHTPTALDPHGGSRQNAGLNQSVTREMSSNTTELVQSHPEYAGASLRYWELALEPV